MNCYYCEHLFAANAEDWMKMNSQESVYHTIVLVQCDKCKKGQRHEISRTNQTSG